MFADTAARYARIPPGSVRGSLGQTHSLTYDAATSYLLTFAGRQAAKTSHFSPVITVPSHRIYDRASAGDAVEQPASFYSDMATSRYYLCLGQGPDPCPAFLVSWPRRWPGVAVARSCQTSATLDFEPCTLRRSPREAGWPRDQCIPTWAHDQLRQSNDLKKVSWSECETRTHGACLLIASAWPPRRSPPCMPRRSPGCCPYRDSASWAGRPRRWQRQA